MTSRWQDVLQILEDQGLIRRVEGSSGGEFQFRHALTQQSAYATLTRRLRREIHRDVGESLESLFPNQLTDLNDVLAHHFLSAGAAAPAACYALGAAARAVDTSAYEEAIGHLQRALDLVGPQGAPELLRALLEALADIHVLLHQGSQAIGFYRRALDSWPEETAGGQTGALRLHRKIVEASAETKWAIEKGDFERLRQASEDSQRSLQDGLALLESQPPHQETVRLRLALSTAAWRMRNDPDWEAARRHAEAAVRDAERLDAPAEHAAALGVLSTSLFSQGRIRDSLEAAQRRLERAQEPGVDVRERLDSLRGAGSAWMYVGEYEKAIPLLLEAETIATRIQSADQIFNTLALLTQSWFRLDRWDDLLAREDQWEEFEQRYPQERTGPVCFPLALRAAVHARRGDEVHSRRLGDRSMDIMLRTWGTSHWLRNAHY